MSEKLTQFDYWLNAMESAGQEDNPARYGYGDKRKALFAYVRGLEAVATPADDLHAAIMNLNCGDGHSSTYKLGHRDARHAAAELVLTLAPAPQARGLTDAEIGLNAWQRIKEKEATRRAALPAGVCPECDGEGEQGGQFTGGSWTCEACNGTGVLAARGVK